MSHWCIKLAWLLGALMLGPQWGWAQTYTNTSVPYAWVDPSTHTRIGPNTSPIRFNGGGGCGTTPPVIDDTLSDPINIGFTFPFGSGNYTQVRVMTNGRLQFGNTTCGNGTTSTSPIQTYPYPYPDAAMNNTMKVFGVDLDPTSRAEVATYSTTCGTASNPNCGVFFRSLGSAPNRRFVVTWNNVPEWISANSTSGGFTIQVILNEDGSFIYQFNNITRSPSNTGLAQVGWQLSTTDFSVTTFGGSVEPQNLSAEKYFRGASVADYRMDEAAWAPNLLGQVVDSDASPHPGLALGNVQTTGAAPAPGGRVCRGAEVPLNSSASQVDAIQTGISLSDSSFSLSGIGTISFWYRANSAWVGGGNAQLIDATLSSGQWFYLTKTNAGTLVFTVTDSTGAVRSVETPAQSFAAGTWVYVAISWDFNGRSAANSDRLLISVNAGTPTSSSFTSSGFLSNQIGIVYAGDNPYGLVGPKGTVNSANGRLDELRIFSYVLTPAQLTVERDRTRTCPVYTVQRLDIQHPSGAGLTCTPSSVTVRACADSACTSLFTGGVSGSLTASGTPTVNWVSGSGNAAGAGFVIPSGQSSVSKSFQVVVPGVVSLGTSGASPGTPSTQCNFGSPSCSFTSSASGFQLLAPNHTADSVSTLTVRAVRSSNNSLECTPAFANVTKPVNLRCAYSNPSTGTLAVRVGGQALNAANSAGAACDASGRAVNLAFNASGEATATLAYADVGQVNVLASFTGTTGSEVGLVMNGSTGFVSRPSAFAFSNIRCTSTSVGQCAQASPGNNPAASNENGGAFLAAGRPFSVTVTALNANGAPTPNYGRESPAEGVLLSANLLAPLGGATPVLSNGAGFGAFSGGAATGSNFSWPEVGIITLSASVADADYLGTGPAASSTSGPVGRFIPAGFALQGVSSLEHRSNLSCASPSGFSYLGENFRVSFTIQAQNASGLITTNYRGAYAKLSLSTPAALGLAGIAGSTPIKSGGRLGLASSGGTWGNGQTTGAFAVAQVQRAASPDGPFTVNFGLAAQDADGVGMRVLDLDTDVPANGLDATSLGLSPAAVFRFGRLRLSNAIGAQDRRLSLPLEAQFWSGAQWELNSGDSCTTVRPEHLSFGNYRKTLTPADSAMVSGSVSLASGRAALLLEKPGGGRTGSYDVALSLGSTAADASCLQTWTPGVPATQGANLAYLRGAWCGSTGWVRDPSARASFGLFKGSDAIVYQRENY